ncbi:MAG: excinuclease ABC subunit UvrA, partial [bacterium]|nr:excinuclease ABC subunit UvrA [bacterium]
AISIDQRKSSRNPRSTVGTITEIYDYLRLLFARVGRPHCPKCGRVVSCQTIDQITDQVLALPVKSEIAILGPVVRDKKGEHRGTLEEIQRAGFARIRVDGIIYRVDEILPHLPPPLSLQSSAIDEVFGKSLDGKKKHNIEVVVDRLILDKDLDKSRLVDSLETALRLGKGMVLIQSTKSGAQKTKNKSEDLIFSEHFACENCGISLPELEPKLFSFNSPYGACPACQGLGRKLEVSPSLVIPNHNLTLAEGAIFPWAHASHKIGRQGYYWWQLQELAKTNNFSLDVPIKELSPKIINLILQGDGKTEGVIPSLERRYYETDSDYTRNEIEQYMVERECEQCQGKRLRPEALAVKINGKSIDEVTETSIDKIKKFFSENFNNSNNDQAKKVIQPIVKEIINRLQFLVDVGLGYLTLARSSDTLSGGEEERIRLATQIGSKLTGVLYVLDEPSIGLHAKDQQRLIKAIKQLKEAGNTVVICEHDPQTIMEADWIIDIGPMAGKRGGKVVFQGTPKQLLKAHTLTGDFLSGRKKIEANIIKAPSQDDKYLIVKGAKEHNLKNIDVKIPLGKFVCITGVSGSGKSSLMNDILARSLLKRIYNAKEEPGEHEAILGAEQLNKVVLV